MDERVPPGLRVLVVTGGRERERLMIPNKNLTDWGCYVKSVAATHEALNLIQGGRIFHFVFAHATEAGYELAAHLAFEKPDLPVILMSENPHRDSVINQARQSGARCLMCLPVRDKEVKMCIKWHMRAPTAPPMLSGEGSSITP